ncbi:MAG TPA: DUF3618 domain-containing protein [Streptosporangiaceae bacterium]|nr:DUF3618 domain-containing protein [Streptosporangiaceae bacterium]
MSTAQPQDNNQPKSTGQLTEEIGRTRQELGDAVQQLVAKTDVKRQLTEKAGQLRGTATARARQVRPPAVAAVAAGVFGVIALVLLMRWRADRGR